jgi:predicted 3-demethylubiquinone-9 3-methyltransferase (glyoxalase superfamily)
MTPAISFVVNCETQEEVDHFWEKLSAGGTKQQCGWLQDKFGVSWQIVPTALAKLMSDPNREKTSRVMQALMQMTKIEIKGLQQAYEKA